MNYYNLFLLSSIPVFGFITLRNVLNINSLIYLLPFSAVFGIISFFVLVLCLSYFLGIYQASLYSLFFLLGLAIFIFLKAKSSTHIEIPKEKKQFIFLLIVLFFLFLFTFLLSDRCGMFDFNFHFAVINNFINTNKFPTGFVFYPQLLIPYHYGFDLISASIIRLLNIDTLLGFKLISSTMSVITFLSVFALLNFLFKIHGIKPNNQFIFSFIGSIFFYFAGNLLFLDSIFRFFFRLSPVEPSWSFFKTIAATGLHGSFMNDFASGGVLFGSLVFGMSFFILLIFLYFNYILDEHLSISKLCLLFLTSISMFHTCEWILYVFILTLICFPFISLLTKDKLGFRKIFRRNFLLFFTFFIILLSNNIIYKILSSEYSYLPGFLELSLNPRFPSIEVFGRFGDLNAHRLISIFSWDFISELGIQFLCLPFVLFWLLKNKYKISSFLISFLLISFCSSALLYIKSSPPDALRLLHPAYEILSVLFFIYVFSIKNSFIRKIRYLSFLILIPPLLNFLLSSIFSPAINTNYLYIDHVDNMLKKLITTADFSSFKKELDFSVGMVKEAATVDRLQKNVSNYLKAFKHEGYTGISLTTTPFSDNGISCLTPSSGAIPKVFTFLTAIKTLDPYLIRELKIKWLYLDVTTFPYVDISVIGGLIKSGFLKEVLRLSDPLLTNNNPIFLFEFTNLENEKIFQGIKRKTYWTFFPYMKNNVIPIINKNGSPAVYLFSSEKAADDFLRNQIKLSKKFHSLKPIVQAASEELILTQAKNGFIVEYF